MTFSSVLESLFSHFYDFFRLLLHKWLIQISHSRQSPTSHGYLCYLSFLQDDTRSHVKQWIQLRIKHLSVFTAAQTELVRFGTQFLVHNYEAIASQSTSHWGDILGPNRHVDSFLTCRNPLAFKFLSPPLESGSNLENWSILHWFLPLASSLPFSSLFVLRNTSNATAISRYAIATSRRLTTVQVHSGMAGGCRRVFFPQRNSFGRGQNTHTTSRRFSPARV